MIAPTDFAEGVKVQDNRKKDIALKTSESETDPTLLDIPNEDQWLI